MAQGTRVTSNLLHDNTQDLFMEVNHGPFLIDHNLLLSGNLARLVAGRRLCAQPDQLGQIEARTETRETPYFTPHTVADMRLSDIKKDRLPLPQQPVRRRQWHGRLQHLGLHSAGQRQRLSGRRQPEHRRRRHGGQTGLQSRRESDRRSRRRMVARNGGRSRLALRAGPPLVTTELLGTAVVPNAPFVQPDGTPYRLDRDYSRAARNAANPSPGPFEFTTDSTLRLKVWPLSDP
jgi:alpha-L-arabinofuranosidase